MNEAMKVILKVNFRGFDNAIVSVNIIERFTVIYIFSKFFSWYFFVSQKLEELFPKEQFNLLLCELEPLLEHLRCYHIDKKRLENQICFNTQKRNQAERVFEKEFHRSLNIAF